MKIYATYYSAEKVKASNPVAAIDLYRSKRIERIFQIAKENNLPFLILSGKFGLLETNDNITYYDHLLTPEEISIHSSIAASQLEQKGITEIVFYVDDVESDKNIQTYIDCISLAADKANVDLEVKPYQSL